MKAYPFYRPGRTNPFIHQPSEPTKTVPQIRLCGNWLAKAGFSPDEPISVTVKEGELLIRKLNANSNSV